MCLSLCTLHPFIRPDETDYMPQSLPTPLATGGKWLATNKRDASHSEQAFYLLEVR